jgi:hypothetical protein
MTVSPVVRTTHDPEAVNWVPLERFVTVAVGHGIAVEATDFMWMGRCVLASEAMVHLYKHVGSRRYLNLDAAGHAYRYRPADGAAGYETITSPATALAEVLEITDTSGSQTLASWSGRDAAGHSPSQGLSL